MKSQKFLTLSVCALFLGGGLSLSHCATAYQNEEGHFTGGFSDTQLSAGVFRVGFFGNSFTSNQRAQDFTMLRAAELCLSHGFPYFIVVHSDNHSHVSTWKDPDKYETTRNMNWSTGQHVSTTYSYTPGQTHTDEKPRVDMIVQGFKSNSAKLGALDAAALVASLKSKYEIP